MKNWRAWIGQAVLYGLFALFIGVFSHWPRYQALPPGQAVLKVSFIHHGQRVAPCRPYSAEELAKLPPNMRTPLKCERERVPVAIEVDLDGATVYPCPRASTASPCGCATAPEPPSATRATPPCG